MRKTNPRVLTNGIRETSRDFHDDIVISGIAGRFPDSDNIKHFQENLFNKVDLVSNDDRRWKLDHPEIPQRTGKVNNINKFDASFFGINYKKAHTMDPMSRMLLEHTYEAIIDAGINPSRLRGTKTGVFIAACFSETEKTWLYEKLQVDGYGYNACDRSMLANRISHWLGVTGPSYAVDTACSSSLFAMEHALRAIRNGSCNSAIVGAANLCLHPFVSLQFYRLGVLSYDGSSKAFDESANGYVRGESISVLYLQKAKDAKRIYATFVHAKTNCDGYKEQGITFPSTGLQTALIEECYEECGVNPKDVAFVEAHGTGTKVGDPEEIRTIESVFCKDRTTPLLIGSVKSNMGHTESTSGLCSVAKVIIAMESGYIPPNLHYKQARRGLQAIAEGRIKVVSELTPWEGGYVAVNSFGFGGANGHVVLMSNLKKKINNGLPNDDLPRLVAVSGRTELAVDVLLSDVESRPVDAEHVSLLHDIHAENVYGHAFRGYTVIGGRNIDRSQMKQIKYHSGIKKQIWFVFSGVGSQWLGMGEALSRFPVFADAILKCNAALKSFGVDIHDILTSRDANGMDDIAKTSAGITAIQIGLADLLAHVGISPDYIIGYSVGEIACAYADGCLTVEQAIVSAYLCGLTSKESKITPGTVATVGLGHTYIKKLCPPDIEVICHDAVDTATISGPTASMRIFMEKLKKNKIFVQEVCYCYIPYHSTGAAPLRAKLTDSLHKVIQSPKPRSCRWLSTSMPRNEWTTPIARLASAEYFANNLLKPVLFQETCSEMSKDAAIIEIGPHALLQNILQSLTKPSVLNVALMQNHHNDNTYVFLRALGELYNIGCQPQIHKLYPKIQYPVSRTTPMISPIIKWDHSEEWYVTTYNKNEKIVSGERVAEVTLDDEDYEYMSGHIIDGRNLFPATGYLYLIWETLGMMRGELYSEFSVVFENVKFQRATTIPRVGSIQLMLMVQKVSGNFEVIEGGAAIVSGSIRAIVDASKEKINPSIAYNEHEEQILSRDIYKELRLRGYHYSGLFRGLRSAAIKGNNGQITWVGNWVTFMDNMLQLKILGIDTRGLFVPTGINKLVIDPKAHLSKIISADSNEKFISAYVHKEFQTIVAGGIEIQGLTASAISKRKPVGKPVLEEYKFIAHRDRTETSLKETVRLVTHIALENNLGLKVKTVEIVDDTKITNSEQLISPMILEILADIPLIQAEVGIAIDSKNVEEGAILQNITVIEPSKLLCEKNTLIAVGHNILSEDKNDLSIQLLAILKDGGFLLTLESIDSSFSNSKWLKDLYIVVEKKTDSGLILLLRKLQKTNNHALVVTVNNSEFSWVEEMKKIFKAEAEKKANERTRIIFVAENDFESGLLGLVNCLTKEPGGEMIRGVLVHDTKAPTFSLKHPIYAKQLALDLTINVLKQEQTWGSYRHMPLAPLTSQHVHHAWINQTVRGDLSSLQWLEGWIQNNFKHENLVHIVYASLNFKDVMLATGKLATEVVATSRLQDCVIGFEYSGFDSSGRRVMGMVTDSALSNMRVADAILRWDVPDKWSLEDAATVTCVYATCCYALYISGKMKKGDKILIHAGSGGIGQAAINLALYEGCEIFTTVGTVEKRKFITETFPQIPDDHIGNSRDTSFEQMIVTETKGKGVDIVLNSLAEEKLLASLRCLARSGRFLEIGKFDLVANNSIGLHNFSREISYHGVMLDNLFNGTNDKKIRLRDLFSTYLKKGAIKPLVRTIYSKDKVETAIRYMAAGNHIGKVLIQVRSDGESLNKSILALPRYHCQYDRSYLILGGLGGFGLELADWMVLRGAKKLILTSRTGIKNGYQRMRVELWKSYGVKVVIISEKDASKLEDCESILKTTAELGPIDGIFNLAVVLKDNFWENQTKETFEESFKSKAWSTKHLDELSRKMCPDLRHFVVFSSVSCGRGNAGQSNYGMANSVMERICEKRAIEGLPALAVQWGAVGDVGLVAEMQEDHKELVIGGTLQQSISSCINELDGFLCQRNPVVASMVVADKHAKSGGASNIVDTVLNILGLKDLKSISQQTSLAELGMDSMMAVDIKQTLEREFEVYLTAQDIRGLNFAKLIHISIQHSEGEKKIDDYGKANSEALNGMRLLLRTLGAEGINSEGSFKLRSKEEEGEYKSQVFLIPGLEGFGSVFLPLADKIRAPVTCLQFSINNDKDICIPGMAQEVLPHVLSKSKAIKNVVLVGYSFGSLVTIELARILEDKGFNCRLVLIDGSPDFVQAIKNQHIASRSDKELQNNVLMGILNFLAPNLSSQLATHLQNDMTWEEKVESMMALTPTGDLKLSRDTKRAICTSIYYRLRAVDGYTNFALQPIRSSILLIKPTLPTLNSIPDDYGLQSVTQGNLEIRYAEGNHATILESDKISDAINGIMI
ncbi:fatty acid synthase-like [Belonocnema kinseyi]|uniref:fatty acid synthase-like n=1 Tax=Belonocnema kinseyi TaxID=2817044 RepID=UPI00143D97D4|nr:fatty acid synthase-like [Belonocnema kinseyi]XP_033230410.1 fatty acid synthase-like [Belonocnema kinseyi]